MTEMARQASDAELSEVSKRVTEKVLKSFQDAFKDELAKDKNLITNLDTLINLSLFTCSNFVVNCLITLHKSCYQYTSEIFIDDLTNELIKYIREHLEFYLKASPVNEKQPIQ